MTFLLGIVSGGIMRNGVVMKRALAAVAIAGVLVLVWQVWAKYEAMREEADAAQAERDVAYQEALARFQHDVRLGMHRVEVRSYLDSEKVSYSQINFNLDIKIGEDPAGEWYCDRWYIYVEFRFNRPKGQTEPSPLDNLDSISIQKIGRCL
jgi:hypothetical protein